MIKNIVFDMGNVVIEWNPKKLSQKITPYCAWVLEKYLFETPVWIQLDAGSISFEDGLKEILKEVPSDYHELVTEAFYHWGEYLDILEGTEKLIPKLKDKGYSIYLLSNASAMFDDYYQKYPVFSYFDGYYISGKHRLMKPSKEIFIDFLNTFDLKAEECLFIDDILDNVEGARKVGMEAYHFKNEIWEIEEILL